MRRILATILMSTLLVTATPFMRGDRGSGRDWDPIRIIKKIVRHLLPTPTDGGDSLGTPKP